MEANLLLEAYLKQLHLPGFLKSYRTVAADAARNNEDHVRYLLALAEQEVHQREQNIQRERTLAPALQVQVSSRRASRPSRNWPISISRPCPT